MNIINAVSVGSAGVVVERLLNSQYVRYSPNANLIHASGTSLRKHNE